MISFHALDHLPPEQLRALAAQLMQRVETLDHQVGTLGKTVETMGKKISRDRTVIEKLTHEIAQLKRFKFAKRSEQLSPQQASLLDDLIDTDIAAIEAELQALQTAPAQAEKKQKPKRTALPAEFPRTLIHHEPDNTHCPCGCALKRIGEDVSEKLDYTPGVFAVERHVRGKWVCDDCETLIQAPVPAQIIDKGIPTAGLLAHVMIAKFADHLPLYRQESIFGRAGLAIPRSTLAQWVGVTGVQLQPLVDALRDVVLGQSVVHADETPVQMLAPGSKKTHRSYVWAYATSQFCKTAAVVYSFEAVEHAGERCLGQADQLGQLRRGQFSLHRQDMQDQQLQRGQATVSAETLGVDFGGLLETADGAENSERIGIGSGLITFNHNKFFVKGPDRPGKFV